VSEQLSSQAGRPLAASRQPGFTLGWPETFSVFGGALQSAIAFPELARCEHLEPSWTLELADAHELPRRCQVLGAIPDQPCRVELSRAEADGFVLSHSCTGAFHVRNSGREIHYATLSSAATDLVRGDVLGRVLPLAMHMGGILSLHASAVALREGAIGFLAPKGFGKSTISLSLTHAGARFVTDDVLPVLPNEPFCVNPGVQSVRLHSDTAHRLLDSSTVTRSGIDGKHIVDELPRDKVVTKPVPLAALYVLSPRRGAELSQLVRRTRLPARLAALELVRHAKIGALLGGSEASIVLERASRIAARVPVYSLNIVRDLDCLRAAAATVSAWHGGAYAAGQ
jgi:hypothetical protein